MSKGGKVVADNIQNLVHARRMASALGNVYITDDKNGIMSFHSIEEYYKNAIADLVRIGVCIEVGKLSICKLDEYYKPVVNRGVKYQVTYNHHRHENEYSKWFSDLKEAVEEFIRLEAKYGK